MNPWGDDGPPGSAGLAGGLFARRIVLLQGNLDERRAGELAIALMTLDATGDDPVSLQVDSADGTLDGALSVIDTVDLLGVPVHATCVGRAEGPALGVLAACDQRRASKNARFRLFAPHERFAGAGREAEDWLRGRRDRLDRFVARLADATGQPGERIDGDIVAGRRLDAEEALRYGLLDEVIGRPDAEVVLFPLPDPGANEPPAR